MHWQLTLTWTELDRSKTQTIDSLKYEEMSQVFRLGRDPSQCHLVFVENTVSRLHVELFFRAELQRFYLRNLQPKNPPKIDGGTLISGEVALHPGSPIELGQLQLTVSDISEVRPHVTLPPTLQNRPQLLPHQPLPIQPLRSPILLSSHYGLECPHCHQLSSLDMRHSACTHCGHFLADAESILIPPSR
ncbi:MAG TPA: FHA domain-containing protein [Oscillatoriales cyanobacterium M59_W2019_021]|nr:FHA domain-containing protein [Oscillatoriales cyanobacterium M4454_W2019_049]HIK50571.1 FHA domain-containing protein [Oscillatoriales cyanobacterium M59_W2019_021]